MNQREILLFRCGHASKHCLFRWSTISTKISEVYAARATREKKHVVNTKRGEKLIAHITKPEDPIRLISCREALAGVFRIIKGGETILSDFISRSYFVPLLTNLVDHSRSEIFLPKAIFVTVIQVFFKNFEIRIIRENGEWDSVWKVVQSWTILKQISTSQATLGWIILCARFFDFSVSWAHKYSIANHLREY